MNCPRCESRLIASIEGPYCLKCGLVNYAKEEGKSMTQTQGSQSTHPDSNFADKSTTSTTARPAINADTASISLKKEVVELTRKHGIEQAIESTGIQEEVIRAWSKEYGSSDYTHDYKMRMAKEALETSAYRVSKKYCISDVTVRLWATRLSSGQEARLVSGRKPDVKSFNTKPTAVSPMPVLREARMPSQKLATTPSFPAFNECWGDSVKIQWLETYAQVFGGEHNGR